MIAILNNLPIALIYLVVLFYLAALIYTIVRILLDTHSTPKTLAYLLLIFVFPVIGIILYYSFGINYRHRRIKVKGEDYYKTLIGDFNKNLNDDTETHLKAHHDILGPYFGLVHFIHNLGSENLNRNMFKLLVNGEEKFPEVLRTLETAKHFIHMEYYAWENDIRGNQIKDLLLKKTIEGVKVRILYDAYASRKIKNNIVKELARNGIEIYPVIKVKIVQLANRINHRDHRKIIIVDGHTGFVGGINVSDRYDNSIDTGLYWRDTHVKITGKTVLNLQRHFLINWNVSQPNPVPFSKELFPIIKEPNSIEQEGFAQIVAGGPIYPFSNIMLTYFKVFTTAKQKLYITNPYFIQTTPYWMH
ncbi:MAG: phospholipase D-like domain-containing protein [Bacteroidales bacterium]